MTNVTTDATINLSHEELRHAPKAGCKCDPTAHGVAATIDLEDALDYAIKDGLTADVFPDRWEFALQLLHDQAHPGGTVSARECREPGCTEFYRGAW